MLLFHPFVQVFLLAGWPHSRRRRRSSTIYSSAEVCRVPLRWLQFIRFRGCAFAVPHTSRLGKFEWKCCGILNSIASAKRQSSTTSRTARTYSHSCARISSPKARKVRIGGKCENFVQPIGIKWNKEDYWCPRGRDYTNNLDLKCKYLSPENINCEWIIKV